VYDAAYAITIGIWDNNTKMVITGNTLDSTATNARRNGIKILFEASVSHSYATAATTASAGLIGNSEILVNNIATANTDLSTSVVAPPSSDVAVTVPKVYGTGGDVKLPCGAGRSLKIGVLLQYDSKTTGVVGQAPIGFLSDQLTSTIGTAGYVTTVASYTSDTAAATDLTSAAIDAIIGCPVVSELYASDILFRSTTRSAPTHISPAILLAQSPENSSANVQWLDPFSTTVWMLLVVSLLMHGTVIWLLESRKNHVNFPFKIHGLLEGVMFSASTLFGFSDKPVRTRCGKIVMLSWYLLALIATATYTASLTSMYLHDFSRAPLTTESDIVKSEKPVCAVTGDGVLNAATLRYNLAVEGTMTQCLQGTTTGLYAATMGLETTIYSAAVSFCETLQLVNIQHPYYRQFTWNLRDGFAAEDQQCIDYAIAGVDNAGLSSYYAWPSSCKDPMIKTSQVTLEMFQGQYILFFVVVALTTLVAGSKAIMQAFDVYPVQGAVDLSGQHIHRKMHSELVSALQAQKIVDNVLHTTLNTLRQDVLDELCTKFGGAPLNVISNSTSLSVVQGEAVELPLIERNAIINEEEGEDDIADGDDDNALTGYANSTEALAAQGPKYFKRYDVNNSGVLDDASELKQLVTNLVYKLQLAHREEDVHQKLKDVDFGAINGWNYPTFQKWFKENFIDAHVPVSATIGLSIRNASRKAQLLGAKKVIR